LHLGAVRIKDWRAGLLCIPQTGVPVYGDSSAERKLKDQQSEEKRRLNKLEYKNNVVVLKCARLLIQAKATKNAVL
jgi:hypothetical protein